jgi:hypothetical protein
VPPKLAACHPSIAMHFNLTTPNQSRIKQFTHMHARMLRTSG